MSQALNLSPRETIHELLVRCSDAKLQRGQPDHAIALARRAYAAASIPELRIWKELAAYRLAHLLLRRADRIAGLREVNELFAEAGGDDRRIGTGDPLASIYRLAVIDRLMRRRQITAAERQQLKQVQESIFQRVTEQIGRTTLLARKPTGSPDPALNRPAYNMLELAAVFAGRTLEPLEGIDLWPLAIETTSSWMVVANRPDWGRVAFTRELAEIEWESISPSPGGIKILYRDGGDGVPQIVAGQRAKPHAMSDEQVRLLAKLMVTPNCSTATLRKYTGINEPATLRKRKQRLNGLLAQMVGRRERAWIDDENRVDAHLDVYIALPLNGLLDE